MGKYDKLVPGLPKFIDTEGKSPDYQQRVNQAKDQFRNPLAPEPTGAELTTAYVALRYEKERLSEQLSGVNLQITALEQMLDDSQERGAPGWGDYGATENTCKLISGESINVQREPYASVTDKDAVREWAVRTGLERSLSLPWGTLNAHMKDLLMLGEPLPPGVKIWSRTKITFRKG